jgi:hypothetical protein
LRLYDKNGHEVFEFPQRYILPVNEAKRTKKGKKKGSVTYILIQAEAGTRCNRFYYGFRKYLQSMGVPVVRYCIEAKLTEVLNCGEFQEGK